MGDWLYHRKDCILDTATFTELKTNKQTPTQPLLSAGTTFAYTEDLSAAQSK